MSDIHISIVLMCCSLVGLLRLCVCMCVQSTVMRRWDGTRIWYPNQKLNAMPLLNMSRSDSKVEIFKVSCSSNCSLPLLSPDLLSPLSSPHLWHCCHVAVLLAEILVLVSDLFL